MIATSGKLGPLVWAVAAQPHMGETESGDRYAVEAFEGGVLLAVVDGLGHGAEAAKVAVEAIDELRQYAGQSLTIIIERVHDRLVRGRGAVISLAEVRDNAELTWAAIGNVDGMLVRAGSDDEREAVLQQAGVLGVRLVKPRSTRLPMNPGDTLVLASDGIRHGYAAEVRSSASVEQIAHVVLSGYAQPNDDALVLVARWQVSSHRSSRGGNA